MPTIAVKPDVHAKLHEFRKQGMSFRRAARAAGVSYGSAHKYINTPLPKADKKVGRFDWREWSAKMQEMQTLRAESSYSQDTADIVLGDGESPVALAGFSDQHMGAWGCDYAKLVEMTDELVRTPNLYIGLLGDYGEYAIKLRSVVEVANNQIPPEQQTDFIESWINEIWHKVAFATWENHGIERQEKLAGESSTKRLLNRKLVYFNGIGHVTIRVGKQTYLGAVSHKFRGTSFLNPVHACQRYMRMEGTDREWAMMGDTHQPGMLKYTDGDKTRVAVNCGSLYANNGYAKRYFSLTTHPVYPIIVFRHDRHEMTPYWSVAEWLAAQKTT